MTITEQLKHAIEEAQRLPEAEQNAIAERILDEIEEREWDTIVSQPHVQHALARLVEAGHEEYQRGKTIEGGLGGEEKSQTTAQFRKLLAHLPAQVQADVREAYRLFARDPYTPALKIKRIQVPGKFPTYSARVNHPYRAVGHVVGHMKEDTIIWEWIGSHEDYNNLF